MEIFIPMPIQVVIDDVGWWSGEDGSNWQEPFRTGINRNHVPADYQAIVDLGKELGIRPQAAIVLCEWDKDNILRQLPTSTWMGDQWDNSKWVGPWLEEAAEIIRNNHEHIELTIHGIGHEYWEEGKFTRAEWTDSNGQMRPSDQIEKHLDYFEKLLDQHDLGPLPESFVPAAFRHSFGPSAGKEISLAGLLINRGVNYINSPFVSMFNKERIQHDFFDFDSGVITIDRGNDEFDWDKFPGLPSGELTGPTCGMHWPNMLHFDPVRNGEVVRKWVDYLKIMDTRCNRMLASDSIVFRRQLVHHTMTKVASTGNSIDLDFSDTDRLPGNYGREGLTLKIKTKKPSLLFNADGLEIESQTTGKDAGALYTLNLIREAGRSTARLVYR